MAQKNGDMLTKKKKGTEPAVDSPSRMDIGRLKQFFLEVRNEFEKIAWPDKKHTIGSTGVVVVLVVIISFYLGAVDLLLGKMIGYILQ